MAGNINQNNTFRLNVKILTHSYEKISISHLDQRKEFRRNRCAKAFQPVSETRRRAEKASGRLRLRLEKPFLAKLDGREQKTTPLDRKCLKQKAVPGLFWSSQATIPKLWASPELLGPPAANRNTNCRSRKIFFAKNRR